MTTYQDPPLQSRRAVRQGERPEQSSPPFAPPQTPRTAAGAGEPLSYVTQNRPPLPGYDQAPPRGRRAADEEQVGTEQAGTEAAQGFRPRDYSPEARTAPPAWSPELDRESGVVEYHTQAREAVIPPAPAAPAPASSLAASLAGEPTEQTLTRRELRALREAHGITAAPPTDVNPVIPEAGVAAAVAPAPVAPAPAPQQFAPSAPQPEPSPRLESALSEFDALAGRPADESRRGRRAAPLTEAAPEDGVGAFTLPEPPAVQPAPEQPVVERPAAVQPEAPALVEPAVIPSVFAEPQAPVEATPVAPAPAPVKAAPPAAVTPAPAAVEPLAPTSVPATGERPVGHWTNQSDLDDREQVGESTISRRVGSGAITTSALVLPSLPGHDMSTGEVMLTGSLSLPANLAATGAHHSIDESDIDHLLDPGDHQLVNTDSVPIRALSAVSSHSGNRQQLIASPKPNRGGRALTALIVSASAMVVVVVTLLVVALSTEVL